MTDPLTTTSQHPGKERHPAYHSVIANFGFTIAQLEDLEEICAVAMDLYRIQQPERAQFALSYRQLFARRRGELEAQLK